MRLLGIDFGESKIGLAYSEGLLASPLSVISVKTQKQMLSEVTSICKRLNIERVVLGLSGGSLDKKILAFGKTVSEVAHVPVDFIDETLTSKEAVKKMVEAKTTKKKRREFEDAVAATILLNTYLENQKTQDTQ